jgi:hypothetical protein
MRKSLDFSLGSILVATVAVVLGIALTAPADDAVENDQPPAPKPLVTISKETTYFTEPLRPDGYVDYMAVANKLASEGVTAENNAVVLLLKAFGPAEIEEKIRDRFQKKLGMESLPDDGDYFLPFDEFIEAKGLKRKALRKAENDWDRCVSRPWKAERYPLVAAWLTRNERAISLMADATRRGRYYSPGIAGEHEPQMVCMILPVIVHTRTAARVLMCRAMLRAGNGDFDEAREDVLAIHRFARSIGTGPTIIDGLVAIAIDAIASQGTATLAYHGSLTKEQAARFATDLAKLPPMPPMCAKLRMERIMYLDSVSYLAREGVQAIARLDGGIQEYEDSIATRLIDWLKARAIDWDTVLRLGNQWYDRLEATAAMPAGAERAAAFQAMNDDLNQILEDSGNFRGIAKSLLSGRSPDQIAGDAIGKVLLAMLLPAMNAVFEAETRNSANLEMEPVTLALSAYRADEGEYPKTLDELTPAYLPTIPDDPYIGEPVRYKRTRKGFVLYCVGPDGEDNGGRGPMSNSYDHDDIAIFAPPKNR